MEETLQSLIAFLDASHSPYHAAAYLAGVLKAAGYTRLAEGEAWSIAPGGKYYLLRGGTSLIAFSVPTGGIRGFMMSASHSDRPTFKVKENGELVGAYTRLATEIYGGMLIAPWLDRPLSIAGRVMVENGEGVQAKLIDIDRDLLLIPNVAIHMNRTANEGIRWNPAVDTLPLVGSRESAGKLEEILEEAAGGKILGRDLTLYVRQKASIWGVNGEFISAAGLDDLECAWGCTQGFLRAGESEAIPVLCVFDNEEVGSSTPQGAASGLLEDTLTRICGALGLDLPRMLSQSFMISADNAHALHPNHPEYADSANAPVLGGGVVLKFNASQRYCTDGMSAALFRMVCRRGNAPMQTYCCRADLRGGSTLGNVSLRHVSIPTVDIGLPQLAMHSCYETAAAADAAALADAMTAYYGCALEISGDGFRLV